MTPVLPEALPAQALNRADANGAVTAASVARLVSEFHQRGLSQRRYRDLTAEKYLIHVDGEGDGQWADIYMGERIIIPRPMGGMRRQENILRPVVENMVAYHTTMPVRYLAEGRSDPESRAMAAIDTALANYIVRKQRLNSVFAEAMWMGAIYGHCPVHAYWRDDVEYDAYEPVHLTDYSGFAPRRGMLDCFAGNPFDTIYDVGSKLGSIPSMSYGRVLKADMLRQAFPNISIEGSDRISSVSTFQRTIRKWVGVLTNVHGSAAMSQDGGGDEMVAVICREWAPRVLTDWPDGRLILVALNGSASTDKGHSQNNHATLLHDGPLPARRFSSTPFYSSFRQDDVLGKPFVADLDDDQVHLNQLLSLRAEYIRRSIRAPFVVQGMIKQDTAVYDDDAQIEVDPSARIAPQFLALPTGAIEAVNRDIEETRQAIYTKGGYQAASRGESHSGDAAAKVIALSRADDTIHGPVNQAFRQSAADYMGLCHALFREYADVPWVLDAMGSDVEYLADEYVDRTKVSQSPTFRVVSGFGASPENRAEILTGLVTMQGADGKPLLSTDEFRKQYPDASLFDNGDDIAGTKRRHAKAVNVLIRRTADQFRQQNGIQDNSMAMPVCQQAGMWVAQQVNQLAMPLRDDDMQAHIDALSQITQDDGEDAIARHAAIQRQNIYFQWQAQAAMQAMQPTITSAAGSTSGVGLPDTSPQAEVRQLTAQAMAQ